jgi:hypothetical protein
MSASWLFVMDTLQRAVAQGSNLAANQVVWKWQNAGARPQDYIVISVGALQTMGQDWVETNTDLARPNGQEVQALVRGVREMPFEIEAFTTATADPNAAIFLAEQVRTSLLLPSIRSMLDLAEVSPFDPGPVQYVPEVVAVRFRGRATCTVRCYVPAPVVVEYVGYIAHVNGTVTAKRTPDDPSPIVRGFSAP